MLTFCIIPVGIYKYNIIELYVFLAPSVSLMSNIKLKLSS